MSCHQTIGPIPPCDLKSEFVAATKKEIASQQHLSEPLKLQLSYSYPPDSGGGRKILGQILRLIDRVLCRLGMIASLC